jgi:hypothetical protein
MSLKIDVELKSIGEREMKGKEQTFAVREFVGETYGQYRNLIGFQATQDRCDILDKFKEGQSVTVHFDIRGNEYNGKVYNNINAWKIEAKEQEAFFTPPAPADQSFPDEDKTPF